MKKIIFVVLSVLFCSAFVFSQNNFERESVLTEEALKSFVKNYKNLFNDLKLENAGKLIYNEKEEALNEIANEERTKQQKENDKQTAAWLSEIKSQINSSDYKLIQKYFEELYEIFNRIEEKI